MEKTELELYNEKILETIDELIKSNEVRKKRFKKENNMKEYHFFRGRIDALNGMRLLYD